MVTIDGTKEHVADMLIWDDESTQIKFPAVLLPEGYREGDPTYSMFGVTQEPQPGRGVSNPLNKLKRKQPNS
jgi:hypothetical protein